MTNEQASDVEILATLKKARQKGVPALLTGQFSDVGGVELGNERLNERLDILKEQGHVGHQFASGRHMWWLSEEGDAADLDLSVLDTIDYAKIDPEDVPEETAIAIAEAKVPGYGNENYWNRKSAEGNTGIKVGAMLLGWPLGVVIVANMFDSIDNILQSFQWINAILGLAVAVGLIFTIVGSGLILASLIGVKLLNKGYVTEEPFREGYPHVLLSMYEDKKSLLKQIYRFRKSSE